jgi:phosphate-selective porin OprO/OprP
LTNRTQSSLRYFQFTAIICAFLCGILPASAQTTSEEIQTLKQLIEEQRKSLNALQEKVRRLEEREADRSSTNARPTLPAIVIDTNGIPISPTNKATENLEARLRDLEQRQNIADTNAAERAKVSPTISVGANGFAFRSAETNFALRFRGMFQSDTRSFIHDNPLNEGNDGFVVRRARPILEGTVFRDFDFLVMPDFAGASPQLFEMWINYRYRPELQLRVGKVNGPSGPENLTLDTLLLLNERSFVDGLMPNRSVGAELWGDVFNAKLNYAIGVFNGAGDGRLPGNSDFGDDKEFQGRIFLQPFRNSNPRFLQGLGFGVQASYSMVSSNAAGLPGTTGGTLPGYLTPGQQQFFAYNPVVGPVVADGQHWRMSPQGYFNCGPFGLLAEYGISDQGVLNAFTLQRTKVRNTAWEVSAQWVLTGEPASLNGIVPNDPFDPRNGGWGAWQIVGRLSGMNIGSTAFQGFSDPTLSANSVFSWSLGLNWWLNRNVRFMTSFSRTHFHGGGEVDPINPIANIPPATVSHQDEMTVFSRIQLAF